MDTNEKTETETLLVEALELLERFREFTDWHEMAFDLHRDHDALKTLATDAGLLRLIDSGMALAAEVEGDLEDKGLIEQTDAAYATITAEGRALLERA